MPTVTTQAAERIATLRESDASAKGKSFRLSLKPSGCAGYEYILALDEKKTDDAVFPQNGFELVIEKKSLPLLENVTIDYKDDGMTSGFKITNPLEKGSCGCGKSKSF